MADKEVDGVIEDARRANIDLHIRDKNGKVFQNSYKKRNRGEEEEKETRAAFAVKESA